MIDCVKAAELKEALPRPILPAYPDWVELYWRAWELAVDNIDHGTPANGFVDSYLGAAFSDNIFQWDTCFIVQFARYGYHFLPVLPSLDNFYRKQHPDGFICREYRGYNGAAMWSKGSADAINPPLFAWAEWGYYQLSGDRDRLQEVLPRLIAYYRWLAARQRNESGLYWSSTWGCGMDNTPRFAASWVDFSAQQALNALSIARIAESIGEGGIGQEYRHEHATLAALINELMWDEEAGLYWDLDSANAPLPVKSIAPFWTLLAGVASRQRAERLVEHLVDAREFWRPHVFPTLSADHPQYDPLGDYWRGGVWAPTNYAVIKGLAGCGQEELALKATENHLRQMTAIYQETRTIWENYSPEYPQPGDIAKGDFVGWSGLGPIALLIEEVLGFEVQAPQNTIRWRLRSLGEQGISDLRFGENTVDLRAERVKEEGIIIHTVARKGFTLRVETRLGTFLQEVPVGEYRFVVPPEAGDSSGNNPCTNKC